MSVIGIGINSAPEEKKEEISSEVKEMLSKFEPDEANLMFKIIKLYETVNGEKLDITNIKNAVEGLAVFNQRQEYNYLNDLLHPEKSKGVKIPSPIPIPSCSFQLHNSLTLRTNSDGNLAVFFNPYFLGNADSLGNAGPFMSSLWFNNSGSLTGTAEDNNFIPTNIGQGIPAVYDQYRLVSGCIVIKYIGRLDIVSGVIGGAIVYEDSKIVGIGNSGTNTDLAKYGNFDLAMDSYYHQENTCLEGIKLLYFPIDNSYEEYIKLLNYSDTEPLSETITTTRTCKDADTYRTGFNQFIYVLGAPPSSSCFKMDIYLNFECLPNATYLNYLPLSVCPSVLSNDQKKKANLMLQKKPILKEKEESAPVIPSIWEKMKKKFKNSLPSIGKMIANGALSSLKSGLGLAGNLLLGAVTSGDAKPMEEDVE